MFIIQLKRTLRSIYFIALAWRTILILRNKGFHEFMLTILPRSLFTTLMDLSYSAFASNCLFLTIPLFYVRVCWTSVFGCSQLNRTWKSLECSVAPYVSHFPAMLSSWCSIDRVSTRFFVSPMYPPPPHNQNLICKHRSNCLVIVYFCYRIVYFQFCSWCKYDPTSCFSKFFSYFGCCKCYPW